MEQWINFEQSFNQRLTCEDLDKQQNKAKNFSLQGHALVRGVAGSGKSLVLRNRIENLIDEGYDDILVLCYNRFMNQWIQSKVAEKGLSLQAESYTFHVWASHKLGYDYKWDTDPIQRKKILELSENKGKIRPYKAILIDEAQDFHDEWFQAMLNCISPETNSIFFVYDNTQSVYGQSHRRKSNWTWPKLGFTIPGGRSQIFELNYRNTPEILELAWQFILPYLELNNMKTGKRSEVGGKIGHIVEPVKKSSRSSSIKPMLVKGSMSPEHIAKQIQLALKSQPDSSIGVLLHPQESKSFKQAISKALTALGIPNHAPQYSRQRNYNVVNRPFVIIDSWNALKGVEFDAVIIAGVDQVADLLDPDEEFEEKSGLYTAITRARDHLVMLYEDKTPVVEQIENILTLPDILEDDSSETKQSA